MAFITVNGRLGNRPELKQSKNGSSYLQFNVAHSEKKDETIWFKCLWMSANSGIVQHLDKGSAVCVIGRLQKPKTFQRRDGSWDSECTIFVSDVSFLPSNKPLDQTTQSRVYASSVSINPANGQMSDIPPEFNDSLPF